MIIHYFVFPSIVVGIFLLIALSLLVIDKNFLIDNID